MTRPPGDSGGRIIVNPAVLEQNGRLCRGLTGDRAVIAVVKGDGYGAGTEVAARALARAGISSFMAGSPMEGQAIKSVVPAAEIEVLWPETDRSLPPAADGIIWTVGASTVHRLLDDLRYPLDVAIEIDAGLGRGGVPYREVGELFDRLAGHPVVRVRRLTLHLPSAAAVAELEHIRDVVERVPYRTHGVLISVGGSDALAHIDLLPAHYGLRIGRLLYGVAPRWMPEAIAERFAEPSVWAVRATQLPHSDHVGYSAARPPSGQPLLLEAGFAHGLPPEAAGRWPVRWRDAGFLIHSVYMLCSVAYPVEGKPEGPDDCAVLLGGGVPVRQVATALGRSTTSILLAPRAPRIVS